MLVKLRDRADQILAETLFGTLATTGPAGIQARWEKAMNTITSSCNTSAQAPARRKKGLGFWIGRVLVGLVIALIAPCAVGAAYQVIATERDKRTYPPPGQMVDVGGYKLHLYCVGQGSPTVILDAGQPLGVPSWAWVQPEIAKATRACAYDRAGSGWSEPGPEPRDGRQMAAELHTLLKNAHTPGPYVLVGHSFGGLVTHLFAASYPTEVAGVVWAEALHPDNFPRKGMRESMLGNIAPEQAAFIPSMARLGLLRLMQALPPDADLPTQQQDEYRALFAATKTWDYIMAVEASFQTTNEQARQAGSLGKIPLLIVIGGRSESAGVGLEMQNELMALSSNHAQRWVAGASHTRLIHHPEYARQTSTSILEVVAAARTGQPLTSK